MFDKFIGSQIVAVSNDGIRLKKDGVEFDLELESDYGDCCGFANFETRMLYEEGSVRNPIITNVETKNDEGYGGDSVVVTFYGEDKALAEVEADAGSGSGWHYGAHVSLRCSALDFDETIVSW